MRVKEFAMPAITRARREIELVAACADHRGVEGVGLAVTISRRGDGVFRRRVFAHDVTPEGLARALEEVAAWIRSGAHA